MIAFMRPVVGVFAHPDDEIFAGGTLATLAKERDVYLVCVTNGEAGVNSSREPRELEDIRQDELRASAKALGVKDVFFLKYGDGDLSNNLYGAVVDKLRETIEELDPEIFITFEPRGVSGHMDHAVTSMLTSYTFEKLSNVKELWYFCFDEAGQKQFKEYFEDFFVYVPPGYKQSDISKTIDISKVWNQKAKAIRAHESQKHDMEKLLEMFEKQKKENIIVLKKGKE